MYRVGPEKILKCDSSCVGPVFLTGRYDQRGRKSEQHPYHPHSKPSSVQSAVGGAHQESVSTATNKHARTDHQPSQRSSSAKNEPSSSLQSKNCRFGRREHGHLVLSVQERSACNRGSTTLKKKNTASVPLFVTDESQFKIQIK